MQGTGPEPDPSAVPEPTEAVRRLAVHAVRYSKTGEADRRVGQGPHNLRPEERPHPLPVSIPAHVSQERRRHAQTPERHCQVQSGPSGKTATRRAGVDLIDDPVADTHDGAHASHWKLVWR